MDNNRKVIELIKINSNKFNEQLNANIICSKWDIFLKKNKLYDIIFADPPYGKIDIYQLKEICFSSLLNNGRFVLETSFRESIPAGGRSKRYGDTMITIWTKTE